MTSGKVARAHEKTRKQPDPEGQNQPPAPSEPESLRWVSARLEPHLIRSLDAHAEKAGVTRSDAIRDCLAIRLETIAERAGIPAGRAEELLQALDGLRTAVEILGPPTLARTRISFED